MKRISATLLEAYRRVVSSDYGDENELIAQVMNKPFTPRWQMLAGSAWHKLLETGQGDTPTEAIPPDPDKFLKSGNYWFAREAVEYGRKLIGPGQWEVKATEIWDLYGMPVEVVAKADHVHGTFIQDNKTKFSTADAKDYEPSIQWRVYLQVHGASCFQYNLFSFKDPDGGGFCAFKDVNSFLFWTYPDILDDCKRLAAEFLDWCHAKRLTEFLEREGSRVPEFA